MIGSLTFKRNHEDLSSKESQKIACFLIDFMRIQALNQVKLLFRGDNFINLKSKLNLYGSEIENSNLNEMLFLIGEKGRGYRKSYQDLIKKKYKIFGIKNVDETVFKYIFKKYRTLMKVKGNLPLQQFGNRNPTFQDFFSQVSNEKVFLETIDGVIDDRKLEIRDYYLTPLHHSGAIGYFNNSLFISTTSDFEIAEQFSAIRKLAHLSERITLLTWIPRPFKNWALSYNYLNISNRMIKKLRLPTYIQSFFPAQKEVTFKGGIFPHYILGYIRERKREFEINPHFFNTAKSFNEIIKDGFTIDQSRFSKKLRETDYKDFFYLNENGTYGDTI